MPPRGFQDDGSEDTFAGGKLEKAALDLSCVDIDRAPDIAFVVSGINQCLLRSNL